MPLKTHNDEQPSLNLTPMIDVVFLLIIFFMVGSQYSELERSIELEVPRVTDSGALTAAPEKRVVNVFSDPVRVPAGVVQHDAGEKTLIYFLDPDGVILELAEYK